MIKQSQKSRFMGILATFDCGQATRDQIWRNMQQCGLAEQEPFQDGVWLVRLGRSTYEVFRVRKFDQWWLNNRIQTAVESDVHPVKYIGPL